MTIERAFAIDGPCASARRRTPKTAFDHIEGAAGVPRAVEFPRDETDRTLARIGAAAMAALDPDRLWPAPRSQESRRP